jgi:imidazolonepropionase-like amidohydrolase
VISTLRAFGGSKAAVANLRALRDAGATVLYGTDFGNTTTPGIDGDELALLAQAGLDGAAILAAGTSTPAAFWGLEGFGRIEIGAEAHVLVLDADPTVDPTTLSRIVRVL